MNNKRVLLINKRGLLINKKILVCILSFKSIIVYNLRFKRVLAYKIDFKTTLTRSLNLIKWINYKAKDLIEFKKSKEFNNFDLFLDFLFNLFY